MKVFAKSDIGKARDLNQDFSTYQMKMIIQNYIY